ncbi:MAG TPA: Ig-like domain-containing protein [Gemmatimonadales bacterium]|nr:Ig-like domain-containing protein [Gemmatimonadales bacterium]
MSGRRGLFTQWWRPAVLLGLTAGLGAAACPKDATGPKKTITTIVISPSAVTLHPGQQRTFTAWGKDSAGDSLAADVTFTASGGSITPAGLYTAGGGTGSYHAIATLSGGIPADTASISVTLAPVASVTVTPVHPSITAGTTVSLSATTKDSSANVLTGRVVTWSSGTPGVGTVDGSGVVTGVSAGITVITATSEGVQGKDTVTVTPASATLVRINLTPDSAAVDTGHTVQFTVTGKFSDSSTAAVPATYSATGGSVNASGLYTGPATAGSYKVIATAVANTALKDTSKVTVTLPTLVRVILTPDSAQVDTGHTQQFTATGKFSDSSSAALAGVTFSATGGTVSGGGLFTAGTATGTFQVIASKSALADTSKVVVVANASSAAECASPQPGWIFCDDFEQDRLSSYFETDGVGTVFNRTAGVGKDGSYGMDGHFTAGALTAGDLHLAFGKTPSSYFKSGTGDSTTKYREIYWRMYVKAQAGWIGGAHDKLTRALVFGSSNFAEAAAAHVWGGDVANGLDTLGLILDPASGVDASGNLVSTGYNAGLTYLGQAKNSPHPTPIFDAAHVGQWYCVEAHVKLNDSGSSNGIFELWINDSLEAQKTGMNWVSSYSAYGINAIYFENYWNDGAAQAEDRYFDNIVVSTQRIGC